MEALGGGINTSRHRGSVERIAEEFDASYYRLVEFDEPDSDLATQQFSNARAASALAYALSLNLDDWCEALYEALSSVGSSDEMILALERMLLHD